MNTNTILIAVAAAAAGYYLSKPAEAPAAVGASWRCQRNPNAPGCDTVRRTATKPHTVIMPTVKTASLRGFNYTPSFAAQYSM